MRGGTASIVSIRRAVVFFVCLAGLLTSWTVHSAFSAEQLLEPPKTITPHTEHSGTTADPHGAQTEASSPPRHDESTASSSSRLYPITVQTKPSPGWCRFLQSAALSNVTVTNLGWDQAYAHRKRPTWILEWIRRRQRQPVGNARTPILMHDWDVVLFADGGDSAFTGVDPTTVLQRFLALRSSIDVNRTDAPVPLLFNAEANCYHQQLFHGVWAAKKVRCISAYKKYRPEVRSKWRYLNAGGWIGYVWAVKQFFQAVEGRLRQDPSLWCDQSVVGGLLLSRKYDELVHLDYTSAVFLPTYHLDPEHDLCPTDDGAEPRGLQLCHSGRSPSVLHFNGQSEGGRAATLLAKASWHARGRTDREQASWATEMIRSTTTLLDRGGGSIATKRVDALCPASRLHVPL